MLLLIGVVLFTDGFILIAQKKIHLGTLLPLVLGLGMCIYATFASRFHLYLTRHPYLRLLFKLSVYGLSLWLISLVGFFCYLHTQVQDAVIKPNTQAIVILGSGVIQGQASPTLALRLDRGAEIAKQVQHALIIVTGGQDFGEIKTEAEVMSAYLQHKHDLPSQRIHLEDQSTSTVLNLHHSAAILKQQGLNLDAEIVIVTSDFHTLRAKAIAQKQGYNNVTLYPAPTPLMTRYNAWLREYFAYVSGWAFREY